MRGLRVCVLLGTICCASCLHSSSLAAHVKLGSHAPSMVQASHRGIMLRSQRSTAMQLRGGTPFASLLEKYEKFMPWKYESIAAWLMGVIKKFLLLLGIGTAISGGGAGKVDEKAAIEEEKKRLAQETPEEKGLREAAEKKLEGVKFKKDLEALVKGKKCVVVITNHAVFEDKDLMRSGEDAVKNPPKIKESALLPLLWLAKHADLFLISQLPKSDPNKIKSLTQFFEKHVEPSDDPKMVHGSWCATDDEKAIHQSLHDAGVFAMGLKKHQNLFCETVEGRGYMMRNIGEMMGQERGKVVLHIDDNKASVKWTQAGCKWCRFICVYTDENKGDFEYVAGMKHPEVVKELSEAFIEDDKKE